MTILFLIILATLLVSLISFVAAILLLLKGEFLDRIILFLVAFSAGALMGVSFFHLLPEAIETAGIDRIIEMFLYALIGFCFLFVFEQILNWHHCHKREHRGIAPFSYLILLSDAVHNFIDGLVIASSFLLGIPTGIFTTIAVISHEIPQEISDYGVLIYGGFKKTTALFLNFLSAIPAILGGVVGFFIAGQIHGFVVFLVPFAAGSFIYIASSDLIPEIKRKSCLGGAKSFKSFFIFLLGLLLMLVFKLVSG